MTQFFRRFLAGLGIGGPADAEPAQAPPQKTDRTINYRFDVATARPMARLDTGDSGPPMAMYKPRPAAPPPPEPQPQPDFDPTPDVPQPFGYKLNWFAIRADEAGAVLDALGLAPTASANWVSGMAASYLSLGSGDGAGWVFASPPVDGWIFLVGRSLPYPVDIRGRHDGIGQAFDAVLARLKSRFDEVLFFGSHRVAGFVAWARARRGEPDRVFAYGDGEVYANRGAQSPEEARLGFPSLDGLRPEQAVERIFALDDAIPDEDDVVALAGLWSVDPTRLDQPEQAPVPGTGLVARLPDDFMRMPG